MDKIIWTPRELRQNLADQDLVNVLGKVMPIYLTSDFLVEVASLGKYSPDVTVTGMGRFLYKNRVLFQHIPHNKVEASKYIYEHCRQTGHLADYAFVAVDNRHANRFYLIFLDSDDSFANYVPLQEPASLNPSQRQILYASIETLADQGIFVPIYSISCDKRTGDFRLFDYTGIIVDQSVNAGQKQEYLDFHRKLLLL